MSIRMRTALIPLLLVGLLAARPAAAALTKDNVSQLGLKWDFRLPAAVTGALLVKDGLLFVPAWDATLYALDPATGRTVWTFHSDFAFVAGVLPTPDGNLCFGNSIAEVFCVRQSDGTLVWKQTLGKPALDAVWSALSTANGRLFVGIASLQDRPCTRGRLVALDLANGNVLWTLHTVPEKVCDTNTSVVCTDDGPCGGGKCIEARGAGVTATPLPDPTGEFVYMNTVGCYTFPSVGDSDSMFKVNATTGRVVWKKRVSPPEQFGFCTADGSVDCGVAGDCANVGGTCRTKNFYHDFGFLNGPLRIEVPDGEGTETLIVSASKNGTLYAFREDDGEIAWTNVVLPTPISPGFAGFGLFNGAPTHADGRIITALNEIIPARVCTNDHTRGCSNDGQCPGGTCIPLPDHLMAFDPRDGRVLWSHDIGASWSSVRVHDGVVYAGTNDEDPVTGASSIFAVDAAKGTRLATLTVPNVSAGRPVVDGDTLFVPYGALSPFGGVRAYTLCGASCAPELCGNGTVEPGEDCDPADPATGGCCASTCRALPADTSCGGTLPVCTTATCDGEGHCRQRPETGPCDDGDACTESDTCSPAGCAGTLASAGGIGCLLDRIAGAPCGGEAVPGAVKRLIGKQLKIVRRTLAKAARLASKGQTSKVEKARRAAGTQIDGLAKITTKAAAASKPAKHISAECKTAIDGLGGRARGALAGVQF